jgi:glycerol uptake facilitator-like aquaporin
VLILIFGPLSGAHFNPVVSLSFAARGELARSDCALYISAQLVGAIAGVWLAHFMFDLAPLQLSHTVRTGPGQWLSEGVATFGLLLTIFGCLASAPASVPCAVGLYITAAYWFTASTSFANPAVTIARSLSDTFAGIAPADAPAFIVAQIIGATAAVVLSRWLWPEEFIAGAKL